MINLGKTVNPALRQLYLRANISTGVKKQDNTLPDG